MPSPLRPSSITSGSPLFGRRRGAHGGSRPIHIQRLPCCRQGLGSPLLWRPVERSLSAFNVAAARPLCEHGRDEDTKARLPRQLQRTRLPCSTRPALTPKARGSGAMTGGASPASRGSHGGCPGPSWSSLLSHLPRALQTHPKYITLLQPLLPCRNRVWAQTPLESLHAGCRVAPAPNLYRPAPPSFQEEQRQSRIYSQWSGEGNAIKGLAHYV